MQLAQMFVGNRITQCQLRTSANVTAYQGQGVVGRCTLLALADKGASIVDVLLPMALHGAKRWEQRAHAECERWSELSAHTANKSQTTSLQACSAMVPEST
jgi:hypothetical protein